MSEKEVGKATSQLPTAIEEHKSNDSVIIDICSKCCIGRVPRTLRRVNEEAYTPQFVSIGPFHHGKPELLGMEDHKRGYFVEFCRRTQKSLADLKQFTRDQHQEVLQNYAGTITVEGDAFVKMVLVDACFIIGLFLRNMENHQDDYILNTPLMRSGITLDLIMFENQLPYAFLLQLYDFAKPKIQLPNLEATSDSTENKEIAEDPLISHEHQSGNASFYPFIKLTCNFFPCTEDTGEESEGTDNFLTQLRSAKKLDAAGVQFFKSENSGFEKIDLKAYNFFGIPCLKSTRLGLPEFCADDNTECLLRNVMALEQCLYPQNTYVCNYIRLLDQLINDTEDVDLLVEKKIVKNALGSNVEVAKLVNKLGDGIVFDDECYKEVCQKLNAHCNNWLHRTRATIKKVYFKDCWTGSTAIVGFFVLLFSISATIKTLFFN